MNTFSQDQLGAFARSIIERAEAANAPRQSAPASVSLHSDRTIALEEQFASFQARHAAERNLLLAVVDRLERDLAVAKGEIAALSNERENMNDTVERLRTDTRALIDDMMRQVTRLVEDRVRS